MIVEPVVQGAGGMRFHSPECVALLRRLCDEHGLLLVLDEIATGFGRTGRMFASEHAGVSPDVMCVGKALTGGYMTLAATLCTAEVAATVSAGEGGGLMHGPTFMANPLACAVALASLQLLDEHDWRARVAAIEAGLRAGLEPARALPGVSDVRVLGAIGVLQLDRDVDIASATAAAVSRGVWLRPFRDLIYAMPPYVIGESDLATVTSRHARRGQRRRRGRQWVRRFPGAGVTVSVPETILAASAARAASCPLAPAPRAPGRSQDRAARPPRDPGARSSPGWSAPVSSAAPAMA